MFDRLLATDRGFTTNEGFSTIFKRPEHKMAVYALLAVAQPLFDTVLCLTLHAFLRLPRRRQVNRARVTPHVPPPVVFRHTHATITLIN